jgi:putative two-component system response regulator
MPNYPIGSILNPSHILIVDDEVIAREILARKLSRLGYACECCEDAQTAIDLLTTRRFSLILADLLDPDMGGVALIKEVMRVSPDTAIVLLTSVVNIEIAVDALKDGVYDYITKPFSMEEVTIRVSRALEKRRLLLENQNYQRTLEDQVASRTRQLKEALGVLQQTYHSTLVALSKALDSRDDDSDGHSLRVTIYARRIAQHLGLSEQEIEVIDQGVLLHDIGKIGIPDALLHKSGRLNDKEWLLMQKHPEIGYRILYSIKFLKGAAQLVLHHHERYDGNGYPQHLSGVQIDLGSRIFSVADALDDLTSDRPFQPAISFEEALKEIAKMSGNQLDPQIVSEFLKIPVFEWKAMRQELSTNTKRADFLRIDSGIKGI